MAEENAVGGAAGSSFLGAGEDFVWDAAFFGGSDGVFGLGCELKEAAK